MLRAVTCALAAAVIVAAAAPAPAAAQSPVSFDRYSLQVGGKRVLVNGGEVHPYRLPAPAAWPPMLRKLRAAGLNEISIYIPWSLHEPAPGTFRWDGRFDLERFLRDARDAGLYVIARPGPYIQGEIDGGGFPGWLLGRPGVLRTVDPNYTAAWKRWFANVMPRIARWQVGGPARGTVIGVQVENEYPGDTDEARAYMRDLVATAKADGITVPVTHNDVQFLGFQLSRGLFTDIVDLFGFDNYPYGFTCCKEWNEATFEQVDQFESYYRGKGVTRSPLYTAEIQGGMAPIAGDDGQTQDQRYRHLAGYSTVQDLSLLGQGLTMINRYMTFGGTTWGNLLFPNDGSSYDYAAPVREWGGLGPRYDELRRTGLQMAALRGHVEATDRVDPAAAGVSSSDPGSVYAVRREAGGDALHIFLRNADPDPDRAPRIAVDGRELPPVHLPGHSARWLVARLDTRGWRVDLSSAEIAHVDRRNLVLFGDRGRAYRAYVDGRAVDFEPQRRPRFIRASGGRRIVVLDRLAASRLWPARGRVTIGPYLVTPREIETTRRTAVFEIAGRRVRRTKLAGPRRVRPPVLSRWRFRADTPEAAPGFDDSGWPALERTTTTNQMQPQTAPVLAADDNGVNGSGFIWYRGRFTGRAGGICLEGRHRFSVWVNGRPLRTVTSGHEVPGPNGFGGLGAAPPVSAPVTVPFPADATGDGENVVAVMVESWGHTMDAGAANQAKQSRGLISASLDRPGSPPCGFTIGGETTVPLGGGSPVTLPSVPRPGGGIDWRIEPNDPLAYPATSGLRGERLGWAGTGPAVDDGWAERSLPDDLPIGPGEVGWLRTGFDARVPRGHEARMGIELPRDSQPANVYLNGVLIARAGRGAYERFVFPPGLMRQRGRNVLAIARWNTGDGTAHMERPALHVYETVRRHSPRGVARALRR